MQYEITYRDTEIPGLHVVRYENGRESWRLRKRWPDGRRTTKTLRAKVTDGKGRGVRAARKEASEITQEAKAAQHAPAKGTPRVAALVEYYLEHKRTRVRGIKAADDRNIRAECAEIKAAMGTVRANELTQRHVEALHRKITKRGSPYMANRVRDRLRAVWNFCQERWRETGMPSSLPNPVKGTRRNREEKREKAALRTADVAELLKAARKLDPDLHDALLVAYVTGQRKDDVMALRWADVDLEAAELTFTIAKAGGKRHRVAGCEALLPMLVERFEMREGPYVFPARRESSRPFRHWPKWAWDKLRTDVGRPKLRVHDIRAAMITEVARAHGIGVAQKRAGHTDTRTTASYLRPDDEDQRLAGAVLAGGLGLEVD